VTSSNWSGYAVESNFSSPAANSVSAVNGSWIVPTVTGSTTTYSSVWVGIDGYSDSTVEQIGTEEDVINGRTMYDAWWEMYSSGIGQPEQVITGLTIKPGDSITASVVYMTSGTHAGQFYLSIVDSSRTNDSFSTYESSSQTQSPLARRNSAEWIVEAPSVGGSIATVANFGSVSFTSASATINGVSGPINSSSWQSQAIDIAVSGATYATTSVLTASGTGFVVTYNTSTGSAAGLGGVVGARPYSSSAAATSPSSKKTASTVVIGPAWTGASSLWTTRTPIRQLKHLAQALSIGNLVNG
jgi:Peptidase A4 family